MVLVTGAAAAILDYLAHRSLPAAVLLGGSAVGAALVLFNSVISR
jgi:predicted ATP-grasp superfamily ATP-dependent carboligase